MCDRMGLDLGWLLTFVWLGLFAAAAGFEVSASEPWWRTYTPIATINQRAEAIETIQPGAARGGTGTLGWYGFWFLDEQNKSGALDACRRRLEQAGVRPVLYYDVGEVGDFAGFFTADGRLRHTGWSLPWWNGREPLTARWVGLEAFFRDVPWAPYPTAKAYGLAPFTTPDGRPADDLYAVLARRGLDDQWHWDFSSNPRITDEIAERSGLARISAKQTGQADAQNKTGWQTVRLVDVDFANPQLSAYCCRELARLVARLRPDGIHVDNLGDMNLGHADAGAFGWWSRHTFREFLQRRLSADERKQMGISDPATFDIAAYVRDKPFESRGLRWHSLNPKWTDDPVWLCYLIHKVESALAYHRAIYAAAKEAARDQRLDCAVFGNTIPFPLGGSLLRGACDIAHFEWSTVHEWWGMRPMGLPPSGRVGYVTRLGAAMSDAPFCWPSIYVAKAFSGAGHEQLHKVIAFDCLANRGLLDFGHAYLDGYSPGTPASAGFVNRFVRAHAVPLSRRRYAADVAVVHSAWSEIASCTVFNPVMDKFVDEYCGWCQFLGDTHRQWTVLLQDDLTEQRLAEHPIVVLPSVLVLTDAQLDLLRRYAASGGRLVATGLTGARYGPERLLAPRPGPFDARGARVVADKPGAAYWRKWPDAAAARRMGELLDWPDFRPRLETDAPFTVGVNLNLGVDPSEPLMTLDLNNCDITAPTDALRPAPPCAVTIRLPDAWRGRGASVRYATPELPPGDPPVPLGDDAIDLDSAAGTLRLRAPSFSTFLLVFIRPS